MSEKKYEGLINLLQRDFSEYGNRIIGSEESMQSAVLVPFLDVDGVESILFEKRAPNIRQGGEICFPGGRVDEEDDTTIETVIRETVEETGIESSLITVQNPAGYMVTRIGAFIEVYMGWMNIKSLDVLKPNPDEVARLFTIPVSFFLDNEPEFYYFRQTIEPWYIDENGNRVELFPSKELGLPEQYWNPWSHGKNRFVVYRYEGEVIWGITARIMYTVSKLMRKI